MSRATRSMVTVGNGQQVSSFWTPLKHCLFTMVLIPTVDAGNVTLEVSINSGSNFYTVLGDDGSDLIICASGEAPAWRDISDYIRAVVDDPDVQLRINLGTVQSAGRTITILQRVD